jgi:hypothetical protein
MNEDIVLCIIAFVESNHDLAMLARTSHALSIHALDKLWSTNTINVVVLARCMPQKFWHETEKFHVPPNLGSGMICCCIRSPSGYRCDYALRVGYVPHSSKVVSLPSSHINKRYC